ncbi:MAG: type VII secretion protein EccB [Mycobacterium sp.]|uniref:type VII secretion protein EccB n=1 Tax=Mycobacterium sp. TaxID=1785 RepID=UPI001EC07491|nr:type VII secretion protein EccB [Mycobacterium sp.]MBW0017218.1 type VII secretion protein EccB [Mycobacterium sp.]
MPYQPSAWLQISGYRFLLRRIEGALLRGEVEAVGPPPRTPNVALAIGCVLTLIAVAACAFFALLRPQARLDRAQIVMGQESGALYVRVGDTWHPVLNLASARLIAATDARPQPVREPELARTKRGALLGIPGAPAVIAQPLSGDESVWTICDADDGSATTVLIGPGAGPGVHRLDPARALLVTPTLGVPTYLLYNGRRAIVDVADPAVLRALRLEAPAPHTVSQSLLNAIPEAPPIRAPRIRGAGRPGRGALTGFSVGSVLRIARGDGDEYYVVLEAGVQRIGQVAADLLRFSNAQGATNVVAVAPDVIRATAAVNDLPVSTFPDRAPTPLDSGPTTVCASWSAGQPDVALLAGSGLPLPAGQAPVALSQADGRGPALDAAYLPPGRSAYVRAQALAQDAAGDATRFLVTDTGVRFAVHDEDAARALGLGTPTPALWPVLATLPCGPELSRQNASVARDTVVVGAP